MKSCPYCRASIYFTANNEWHTCHACGGIVRNSTASVSSGRVEAGSRVSDSVIVVVTVPYGSRLQPARTPLTPDPGLPQTSPTRILPTTPPRSSTSARPTAASRPPAAASQTNVPARTTTNQPATSSLSQASPATLNSTQVRSERDRIRQEIEVINSLVLTLRSDLTQPANDSQRIRVVGGELANQVNRLNELQLRDAALEARQQELIAQQAERTRRMENNTAQTNAEPDSKSDNGSSCLIAALIGAGCMVGFSLFAQIQWRLEVVLVMLGVGVGIAFMGWIIGVSSK